MGLGAAFSTANISASGLAAERLRMEVVANNIANAHSTRTPEGGAFRRQHVIFATAFDQAFGVPSDDGTQFHGVRVVGVEQDSSPLHRIFEPDHPDAGPDGYLELPNVSMPNEMVDLITASRAYDANLRALRTFREMVENTIQLMRGFG